MLADLEVSQKAELDPTGLVAVVGAENIVWHSDVIGAAATEAYALGTAWLAGSSRSRGTCLSRTCFTHGSRGSDDGQIDGFSRRTSMSSSPSASIRSMSPCRAA